MAAAVLCNWTVASNFSSSADCLIPSADLRAGRSGTCRDESRRYKARSGCQPSAPRISLCTVAHLTSTLVDNIAVVGYKVYDFLPASACLPVQEICFAGECLNARLGIRTSLMSAPTCLSHTGPSAIERRKFLVRLPGDRAGGGPWGQAAMAYLTQGVFEEVRSHLQTYPGSSLADVCRALHIERHTVERVVRRATGKCFRDFRREALLQRALNLLQYEPGKSIKEIAFMLGFRSTRSFDRFVLASCGHTPTHLRQSSPVNTSKRPK